MLTQRELTCIAIIVVRRWMKRRMTMAVKEKLRDIWGKRGEEWYETL